MKRQGATIQACSQISISALKVQTPNVGGWLTTDAGGLLLREVDRALGLMNAVDECIPDPRDQRDVIHGHHTKLLVNYLRQHWPDVRITLRADSGFSRGRLMRWCDNHGVSYLLRLANNPVLKERINAIAEKAEEGSTQTGEKQRLLPLSGTLQDHFSGASLHPSFCALASRGTSENHTTPTGGEGHFARALPIHRCRPRDPTRNSRK